MQTYFRKVQCPSCKEYHDPILGKCPHCGHQEGRKNPFEHYLPFGYPSQLVFFLLCWVGFQIFGAFAGIIAGIVYGAVHPEATRADLIAYLSGAEANILLSGIGYGLLFAAICLIVCLQHRIIPLLKSFKGWKPYVAGFIGFAVIFGGTWLYSLMVNGIFVAAGWGEIGVNENELLIRQMTTSYPVACFIVVGLLGPIVEEFGYRVGLFGFLSRLGKPIAYIVGAVIFGFIHFGWDAFFSGDARTIVIELVNIPTYVGSGAILCLLYDRFGFGASTFAHILNNMTSLILTVAGA